MNVSWVVTKTLWGDLWVVESDWQMKSIEVSINQSINTQGEQIKFGKVRVIPKSERSPSGGAQSVCPVVQNAARPELAAAGGQLFLPWWGGGVGPQPPGPGPQCGVQYCPLPFPRNVSDIPPSLLGHSACVRVCKTGKRRKPP